MSGEAVQRGDLLRFRLGAFQRQVERARVVVREALAVMARPYVAFSGGKDSLVVLDLVRQECPRIVVEWGDEELIHDETPAFVSSLCAAWGLSLLAPVAVHPLCEWFTSWSDVPFWREPMPGAVVVPQEWQGDTVRWLPSLGFDGWFIGLRAREAPRRRTFLRTGGLLRQTRNGWQCNPIGWWTVDDVWAYIAGRGLPYNAVYDRLAAIGVPREQQRVGPLPLTPGWMLRAGWPEVYRRLVERYGRRW